MGLLHFSETISSNQPCLPQLFIHPPLLLLSLPLFTSESSSYLFKIKFLGNHMVFLSNLQVTAY